MSVGAVRDVGGKAGLEEAQRLTVCRNRKWCDAPGDRLEQKQNNNLSSQKSYVYMKFMIFLFMQ